MGRPRRRGRNRVVGDPLRQRDDHRQAAGYRGQCAVVASNVAFNGTGDWASWQTKTITAGLVAGANTVRASATTANGGPNLDYLEVSGHRRHRIRVAFAVSHG